MKDNGKLEDWIEWTYRDARSWVRRKVYPDTLHFFVSLSTKTALGLFVSDADRDQVEARIYGSVFERFVREGRLITE